MVLESFKLAFRYSMIKWGVIFLMAALLLSIAGMYSVSRTYSHSDVIGPGNYTLGDDDFETSYFLYNRTLTLSGNGIVEVNNFSYSVTGNMSLSLPERPRISVRTGVFRYNYSVVAEDYPFASLSLPALVFMLVGGVLSILGYIRMLGDLRGERK